MTDEELASVCHLRYLCCLFGSGVECLPCSGEVFLGECRLVEKEVDILNEGDYLGEADSVGAVSILARSDARRYLVGCRYFFKEESAARHTVFEGDGADTEGAVFIDAMYAPRVDDVEDDLEADALTEVVNLGSEEFL